MFLELYQCFCDFVNLKINHFREEKMISFQQNILLHASKILKKEGWDTRKGACMTRYVRSAQVTLEVTGTGCYRGKGVWGGWVGGLRKQSWGGGIFNPKLNADDPLVQFIILHVDHQIFQTWARHGLSWSCPATWTSRPLWTRVMHKGGWGTRTWGGEGEDENKGGKRGKQASVASYLPSTLVQAMSVFRRGKNLKLM